VFAIDLPQWSQRAEFVLASGWATFAASERIRERALEAMIPDLQGVRFRFERRHLRTQPAPGQGGAAGARAFLSGAAPAAAHGG